MKAALRILVADDDRDTVALLATVLRHVGHEVLGVFNGAGILREVAEFRPDVVVLDLQMPGMNGFEVAEHLVQHRPVPRLIAITGVYLERHDRFRAQLAGFDQFLLKPFEPSDLLRALSSEGRPDG